MKPGGKDVVYGINAVTELLSRDAMRIERVLFAAEPNHRLFALLKQCRKLRIPVQTVPARKLAEAAGSAKHQGVVVRCSAKPYGDTDEVLERLERSRSPGLLLVPASVEDPHNLGAIIRSSVAFGVSAVFVERHNTAGLSSSVAKASAGMLEYITVCRPRSLEAVLKVCRKRGYAIVGAIAGSSSGPRHMDFTGPTVLVVGGEDKGIPPYLKKLCTAMVAIPIDSRVPSLNVSVAAAILLYECALQRGLSAAGGPIKKAAPH